MGQTSYIYEAGCAVVIDGERTYLTGDLVTDDDGTPATRRWSPPASPTCSSSASRPARVPRALARRPRALATCSAARSTSPRRTRCSPSNGHEDLRFLDNGAIGQPDDGDRGAPTPTTWSRPGRARRRAVAFHMRARGYAPEECIAVGDSVEDLDVGRGRSGRFFVPANGPDRDAALREAIAGLRERDRDRGRDGRRLLRGGGRDARGRLTPFPRLDL